jgi:MOSC domain-containing protein YiiM
MTDEDAVVAEKSNHGGREVTLIELKAVDALFGGAINAGGVRLRIKLAAPDARRNIVTADVPLNHLVDRKFLVGAVRMRGTRLCEPCKHLEKLTQPGVLSGLIHRGGCEPLFWTRALSTSAMSSENKILLE